MIVQKLDPTAKASKQSQSEFLTNAFLQPDMLYQHVISPLRDSSSISRAFYENKFLNNGEERPIFIFGKGIKSPNQNQMGAFGDEIQGNLFSPQLLSSVRYFSNNNAHSSFAGGGLGSLEYDHRTEPVHGIEYIIPTRYIQETDRYAIHFVVYAQRQNPTGGLSHSSSAPLLRGGNQQTYSQYGLYNKEFYAQQDLHTAASYKDSAYLVPSVPVKYLDVDVLNTDVSRMLQLMYYEQEEQAQLYSLGDAIEVIQREVRKGQHLFK